VLRFVGGACVCRCLESHVLSLRDLLFPYM
jgi:hypothetical protein